MSKIQFTRLKGYDVNGNARYVCHYVNLLTESDNQLYPIICDTIAQTRDNLERRYALAVKRANKIGGRKYHTKAYGGGIVFQVSSLQEVEQAILRVVAEAQQEK